MHSEKKAGPDDPHIRVIGLHQKRLAYPCQSTRFQNESKDFRYLLAYVVNLPAKACRHILKYKTSLQYKICIYILKPAHFLPYEKCNFTFSLVTHSFRATFLLPCMHSQCTICLNRANYSTDFLIDKHIKQNINFFT